jgi:hypothetical protein
MAVPNGVIVYEGPSQLDGEPIVAVATGIAKSSQNSKTGTMVQVYIVRSDVSPTTAINEGQDKSVCGTCPLRGIIENGRNRARGCYVSVRNAPRSVFMAFKNQRYPKFDPEVHGDSLNGKSLRISAYGDPSAVPLKVWEDFLWHFDSHTGYTHMWRTTDQRFRRFLMASVHSAQEALEAKSMGWRYFRSKFESEPAVPGEFFCPAAEGRKTFGLVTCSKCLSCGGVQDKPKIANPVIDVHGGRAAESGYMRTLANNSPRQPELSPN